jgi:hypothetical protein
MRYQKIACLTLASTFFFDAKDVDGRNKAGHDEVKAFQLRHCALKALRFSGLYRFG